MPHARLPRDITSPWNGSVRMRNAAMMMLPDLFQTIYLNLCKILKDTYILIGLIDGGFTCCKDLRKHKTSFRCQNC